ncbi:radical SAM/SPASM domain-containing protein [Candidatus Korarchaeum cryptofilum]|jgi:radical SAM protein with 4Fe4S-binding SPASM domain|uniref:Radical SAM domain protein n=1 Tax=Korarchaeum cryptofilum (strain OPF8) TaxID=374847 RepID=B1L7M3_KORCO|nr:radical SAM/SPASM domain-containing protein [Candidatus Korarchaeum cryptofilum]ACB06850.1 Radical SAM domain protein [Candidatus Korarchaeum cryptofilum OPF8]
MANDINVNELILDIRRILGNGLTRRFIKMIGKPLDIVKILSIYAGLEDPSSAKERVLSEMISYILSKSADKFGFDESVLKERLKDPYMRRGIANILLGIAYYGITRPQRLYSPFMVVWDFTKRCNLSCLHCYANASYLPPPDELNLEERLSVLSQLDEAGVAAISFSGGEPLIVPDFWEVARRAAQAGMYISIATNGTLIKPEVARRLKEIGVRYVEVSLDSPNPESHDSFRGIRGAWERSVEGIKNAKSAGMDVGIAMTITKKNYREVADMIKLAKELGVDRFIAFNFIPTGRGKDIVEYDLSPKERMEVLELLYSELSNGFQAFSTSPIYAIVSLKHVDKGGKLTPTHFAELAIPEEYMSMGFALAEFLGGCGAGRIYCSVEHNGDIQPCVFMPIVVGNVLRDGFLKVWQENELLNKLRDRDYSGYACSTCGYRYICGGCRARALAYYNDPLGPDPSCEFNEKLWDELRAISISH